MTITNTSEGLNTAWTNANGEFAQDALYKYVIKSVTASVDTVKVTQKKTSSDGKTTVNEPITASNPVTINGGRSVTLDITGSAANFTPVTFEIVYDITEEHGEKLIENGVAYAYSYVSNIVSDADLHSRTTVNNFALKDLRRYVYTSSRSGFEQTLRIEHEYEEGAYNGEGKITAVVVEGDKLPDGLIINPDVNETLAAVKSVGEFSIAYVKLISRDKSYVRPEGAEPQYGTYNVNLGVVINGTKITVPVTFCYFNDGNLEELVQNCQAENLQSVDFRGGETSAEWIEYKAALTYAAGIANIPYRQLILDQKLPYMAPAAERLAKARTALEDLWVSSAKDILTEILKKYEGNADDEDMPLADPNRNYIGREDFILYTYLRCKKYRNDVDKALEKKQIDSVEATYKLHKLELNVDRLIPRWPDTLQLEKVVARFEEAEYDESLYTEASWERAMEAYEYALKLIDLWNSDDRFDENGNPDLDILSQSQINVTRRALIRAEKELVIDTSIAADYTAVEAAKEKVPTDLTIYVNGDAVTAAVNAVVYGLNITKQAEVNAMAKAIEDAIASLELRAADYTAVEEAKAKIPEDLSIYTDESVANLQTAIDSVEYDRDITKQAEVDAMAKAIEDAIASLKPRAADYTWLDDCIERAEAIDTSLYTDETVAILEEALAEAKNVDRDLTEDEQDIIDEAAGKLKAAIDGLKYKDADYTAVEAAKAKIPADLTAYTDETVAILNTAVEAVVEGLKVDEQARVDKFATDIEAAIKALELKSADYTAVEEAIANIPADLTVYTDESVANLQTAIDSVEYDRDITKQAEVDAMAKAIEDAIAALELKLELKADYTWLDQYIRIAEAFNTSLYTDETAAILEEALAEAKDVPRDLTIEGQYKINEAAGKLEAAINGLKYKGADYTWLDYYIEIAKEILNGDLSAVPPVLVNQLKNELEKAKAVSRDLPVVDQPVIDEAAKKLEKIIRAITDVYKLPGDPIVKIVPGTKLIIDDWSSPSLIGTENKLIYGLEEGMSNLDGFIEVINGSIEYEYVYEGRLGTGVKVKIIDNDGNVFDSYDVVIFGDYNGDSSVDAEDATYFSSMANYEIFDHYYKAYLYLASDVNRDGSVDAMDEADMLAVSNYEAYIDQTITEGSRVIYW